MLFQGAPTSHQAPLCHQRSSSETQVPGSVLAGLSKCFRECAPTTQLFLPGTLPCPSQHGSSCLWPVPGSGWNCSHQNVVFQWRWMYSEEILSLWSSFTQSWTHLWTPSPSLTTTWVIPCPMQASPEISSSLQMTPLSWRRDQLPAKLSWIALSNGWSGWD